MKFNSYILPLAATAKLVVSHTTIHAAWINGADQGLGNSAAGYIRSPPNNNPVLDVNSPDLTCNVNGRTPVDKNLNVKPGDQFGFEWHHMSRDPSDQIIDPSHKGPVLVYMAPADAGSAGNNWVKIAEDGYDASSNKWAVDKLIESRGIHYVSIPDVQTGDYLLRAEIIALHEADRGAAQFYMECVQVHVTSSSTQALPAGVSLPGDYKADHPGIFFNMYSGVTSYPIPGPALWTGGNAPSNPTTPPPAPEQPATPPPATEQPATPPPATEQPTTPPPSSSGEVPLYEQCGGEGWTGPTACVAGSTCQPQAGNPYYSQCL